MVQCSHGSGSSEGFSRNSADSCQFGIRTHRHRPPGTVATSACRAATPSGPLLDICLSQNRGEVCRIEESRRFRYDGRDGSNRRMSREVLANERSDLMYAMVGDTTYWHSSTQKRISGH